MRPPRKKDALPIPTEELEQKAFVHWFYMQFPRVLIYAIPNGAYLGGTAGQRAGQMGRLRATGLRPGIPDLHIPGWRLWVEMKRTKDGRVEPEQKAIHDHLRSIGHTVIVAKGCDDAIAAVRRFTLVAPE